MAFMQPPFSRNMSALRWDIRLEFVSDFACALISFGVSQHDVASVGYSCHEPVCLTKDCADMHCCVNAIPATASAATDEHGASHRQHDAPRSLSSISVDRVAASHMKPLELGDHKNAHGHSHGNQAGHGHSHGPVDE